MNNCNCSDIASEVKWLDARNLARTTYLARLIEKRSTTELHGIRLANTFNELKSLSVQSFAASTTPKLIFTKSALIELALSPEHLNATSLRGIDNHALERFISEAEFADYLENGKRYRFLHTMYYGDLMKTCGMTYDDIFDLLAMFGYSDLMAQGAAEKKACSRNLPEKGCQDWAGYSCPFSGGC